MRKITLLACILCGILLLSFGVTSAQDDEKIPPQYTGMRLCFACHSDVGAAHQTSAHVLTLQPASGNVILGDLDQDTDLLILPLPGEDEARALTADDITFTLGTGKYIQRYVIEIESEEGTSYMVLPVQWNTTQQAWEAYAPAGSWPAPAYDFTTNCAGCHTTGLNLETASWMDTGVQCEACHGPGTEHVTTIQGATDRESPEALELIRSTISLTADSQVCGQCHSQGTNPDGIPFPTEYLPGDNLLDEEVFTLAAPDDEAHWWASGHASSTNMQFNESLLSKHESALEGLRSSEYAQDECLACHSTDYNWTETLIALHDEGTRPGNAPDPLTVDTAQFGVTCSSCHSIHAVASAGTDDAENGTEGSTPDASDTTYALCTSCHQDTDVTGTLHHPVREMFEGETLIQEVAGTPSPHYSAENGPTCTTCHMPEVPTDGGPRNSHTFAPVLPGQALNIDMLQDTCSSCHASQVNAVGLQAFIDDVQSGTQRRITDARAAVTDSTPDWVTSALDFVESDGSLGVHNYTYSDALLDAVEAEMQSNADAIQMNDNELAADEQDSPPTETESAEDANDSTEDTEESQQ